MLADSSFDDTVKYFLSRARARGILAISSAVFVENWMAIHRHYYQVGGIKGPRPVKWQADNWHAQYTNQAMSELCTYQAKLFRFAIPMGYDPVWASEQTGLAQVRLPFPSTFGLLPV